MHYRSLTPFLRSQGRADGQGIIFHSRISPSPNRSLHRRRQRHRHSRGSLDSDTGPEEMARERMPRRNLQREMEVCCMYIVSVLRPETPLLMSSFF